MNRQFDPSKFAQGAPLGALVLVGLAVLTLISCFTTIPAGHRGVKLRFGRVAGESLGSGLQFKLPFIEQINDVEIREQKLEQQTSASSKDLQTVKTQIAVNYHPDVEKVHLLYEEVGPEYSDRVLNPAVEETVKAVTAQYTAEELITKRTEVRDKMEDMLRSRVVRNHVNIAKFSIVNFEFSAAFNDAIEAKQTAEQQALQAKNILTRMKVEADQKIEQARGAAESVKLAAKAEAEAVLALAEAEAMAQEKLAKVVNKDVITLRAIEKWDGVMPRVSGEATPMFFLNEEPSKK